MKKQVLVSAMTLLTALSAMAASSLSNGDYTGQTSDGRQCGLRIRPNEYINGMTRIDFSWRKNGGGYEAGYVEIKDNEIRIDGDTLAVKSNNDIAVAKVKLTLANDGAPIKAKMGLGMLVQIGYDETCYELVRK